MSEKNKHGHNFQNITSTKFCNLPLKVLALKVCFMFSKYKGSKELGTSLLDTELDIYSGIRPLKSSVFDLKQRSKREAASGWGRSRWVVCKGCLFFLLLNTRIYLSSHSYLSAENSCQNIKFESEKMRFIKTQLCTY